MNSSIEVKRIDIIELNVDAIVNAANSQLQEGGGVCGAIFREAGSAELAEACYEIGICETDDAIITPGFNLPAKYIIPAVGPIWQGEDDEEKELLYNAYKHSLILAKENDCHSIGFPLISSGIIRISKKVQVWEIAVQSCSDFINEHLDIYKYCLCSIKR